jgi:hypothetical protein
MKSVYTEEELILTPIKIGMWRLCLQKIGKGKLQLNYLLKIDNR